MPTPATTNIFSLYDSLQMRGPRPALTFYDSFGRIEYSGAVLANNMAKIASFLQDELWREPGMTTSIDAPLTARSFLWHLGAFLAGLQVIPPPLLNSHTTQSPSPLSHSLDTLITSNPEKYPPSTRMDSLAAFAGEDFSFSQECEYVAIDLAPLAFSWTGRALAGEFIDGCAGALSGSDTYTGPTHDRRINESFWLHGFDLCSQLPISLSASPASYCVKTTNITDSLSIALLLLPRHHLIFICDEEKDEHECETIAHTEGAQFLSLS